MFRSRDHGWVEVICGPMFSGKSEELIRRVTRVRIARRPVQVFKPELDDRYSETEVVSHSSLSVRAEPVPDSAALLALVDDETQVVGVDEAQFFDQGLVEVSEHLARSGRQVIVAGLDLDYLGRPFEPVPTLVGRAEYVTKALAVCVRCGDPANFTQRTIAGGDLVVLGATESYEARCRRCWDPTEPEQPTLDV
jgi:thymidine kinase